MTEELSRRKLVYGIGFTAAAGALAGCSTSTSGDGDDGGESGGDGGDTGTVPSAVSDYLSDANGFDGSITDETGSDSARVMVGAGSDGLAFDPTAVRVSSGTTVTWEWTGEATPHNVVDEDGEFESELLSEEGATFEHTFEESGSYRYYCGPHQNLGMLGAIVVE